MAFVTVPVAQIISEIRSTIMDRIHMGGTFLQQAPTVTIGGLPVAIRKGGLGALGSALGGALGPLGGLSGLASIASQISALKDLANLPGIGDLKSLAGELSGLGDALGDLSSLTSNLDLVKTLSSSLGDALGSISDISQLGDLSSLAEGLGGLDALKDQISQVKDFSSQLSDLNKLTDGITTSGISELLQNPVLDKLNDVVSNVDSLGNLSSGLISDVSSVIDSVSPGLSSILNSAVNTTLRDSISAIETHTNTLSGVAEKTESNFFGLQDIVQTGTNVSNSLGVDQNTFLQTTASALFADNKYSTIKDDISGNITRSLNVIKNLTPDGGANDALILSTTNRLINEINNHAGTMNAIIESDKTKANTYISAYDAVSKVENVTNMVNAEGFSGLKSMIVKTKYQNLVSYK